MRVRIQYGKSDLELKAPSSSVTVLEPRYLPGLPDERSAFLAAVRAPLGCRPLRECVRSTDRVAVVIPDVTRPFPSHRVLPWLLEEISHVAPERFTIILGNGTHRPATIEELIGLLGRPIMSRVPVVNHDAFDTSSMAPVGNRNGNEPVLLNRRYVEADRRIVLGFIEPHFFAGFSGGYKGVFPGVADIASIIHYHRADVIEDPRSTWGVVEENPTQEQIRLLGAALPVDFLVNLTLNKKREITRFFCGEALDAHTQGCAFAREAAMIPCDREYAVVVTSNSGYPLDRNLYQSVKGMSAAEQIVVPDGLILMASRCNEGFPDHGNFARLLLESRSPEDLLRNVHAPGFSMADQWEAQKLALVLRKARVALFSELAPELVRRAHLEPVTDLNARLVEEMSKIGPDAPVAVLPEGPMTIPFVSR